MADILYSIGHDVGGGFVLTVYEGEKAATIELSRELAAQLAAVLTDDGKDSDGGAGFELPPPVLTEEELNGLDKLLPAQ